MGITYKLWASCAGQLAAGTTTAVGSTSAWIGLETSSTMAATYTAATNAFVAECSSAGLVRAAATLSNSTTAQTNDTFRSTLTFTCGATTGVVWGHACMTASTAGDMYSWYAYAGVVNLASGDTLAATIDHQFVAGS